MMKLKDITCISDLYYVVGSWFTLMLFIVAVGTLPFALEMWDSIWSFLMCGGIAFVGAAPKFKEVFEGRVHYVAALMSAVCSVIWTWHICPLALSVLLMAVISLDDKDRWLLWCEIPCFTMVYIALMFS